MSACETAPARRNAQHNCRSRQARRSRHSAQRGDAYGAHRTAHLCVSATASTQAEVAAPVATRRDSARQQHRLRAQRAARLLDAVRPAGGTPRERARKASAPQRRRATWRLRHMIAAGHRKPPYGMPAAQVGTLHMAHRSLSPFISGRTKSSRSLSSRHTSCRFRKSSDTKRLISSRACTRQAPRAHSATLRYLRRGPSAQRARCQRCTATRLPRFRKSRRFAADAAASASSTRVLDSACRTPCPESWRGGTAAPHQAAARERGVAACVGRAPVAGTAGDARRATAAGTAAQRLRIRFQRRVRARARTTRARRAHQRRSAARRRAAKTPRATQHRARTAGRAAQRRAWSRASTRSTHTRTPVSAPRAPAAGSACLRTASRRVVTTARPRRCLRHGRALLQVPACVHQLAAQHRGQLLVQQRRVQLAHLSPSQQRREQCARCGVARERTRIVRASGGASAARPDGPAPSQQRRKSSTSADMLRSRECGAQPRRARNAGRLARARTGVVVARLLYVLRSASGPQALDGGSGLARYASRRDLARLVTKLTSAVAACFAEVHGDACSRREGSGQTAPGRSTRGGSGERAQSRAHTDTRCARMRVYFSLDAALSFACCSLRTWWWGGAAQPSRSALQIDGTRAAGRQRAGRAPSSQSSAPPPGKRARCGRAPRHRSARRRTRGAPSSCCATCACCCTSPGAGAAPAQTAGAQRPAAPREAEGRSTAHALAALKRRRRTLQGGAGRGTAARRAPR